MQQNFGVIKNKYEVVIIEDDKTSLIYLQNLLLKNHHDLKIVYQNSSFSDLQNFLTRNIPDIIMMDVELKDGNSLSKINHDKNIPKFEVILMSSKGKFYKPALENGAASFLQKPIHPNQLSKSLEEVRKNILEKNRSDFLKDSDKIKSNILGVSTMTGIDVINTSEIQYLQAEGRYTFIYLDLDYKKMAARNIGEYDKILNKEIFFRVHTSYIVNFTFVKRIFKGKNHHLELINGQKLPISRRRISELRQFLCLSHSAK